MPALQLVQDAWNYKALVLYASQGGIMTGNKDASPVQWTPINLASQVSQTWTHTLNFVASNGGLTNTPGGAGQTPATDGVWTVGQGWVATTVTLTGPNKTITAVDVDLTIPGNATITSATMTYTVTKGTFDSAGANNGFSLSRGGVTQASDFVASDTDADGSGKTRTVSGSYTADSAHLQIRVSSYTTGGPGSDGTGLIASLVLRGTGANPFGGGVSSGNETFVGNLTFSINYRGWASWLSDDSTNIRFVSTKNYFQSNVAVTLCGTADSTQGYVQNVTTGSYNNPDGVGVIFAAAGSAILRSLDWGSSWSTLHYLSPGGGCVNVGYATTAGAANASPSSPEYTFCVGNIGGGSVGFRRANGATAIVNTAGNVPLTAQCLVSFTTNSSYYFLGCGTVLYYSDDAGATWTARYPGGTIYGVSSSPQNHLFGLVYGPSLLKYTVDGGANFTDLHTSWRGFADVQYGAGTALNIVTSCADLSVLYRDPVTN